MAVFVSLSKKSTNNIVTLSNSSHITTRDTSAGIVANTTRSSFSTQFNEKLVPLNEVYQPICTCLGGKSYGYGAQNVGVASVFASAGISLPDLPTKPKPCDPNAEPGEPGYLDPCENPCFRCAPDGKIVSRVDKPGWFCIPDGCDAFGLPKYIVGDSAPYIYGPCFKTNEITGEIESLSTLCEECQPLADAYTPDGLPIYLPPLGKTPRTIYETKAIQGVMYVELCPDDTYCVTTAELVYTDGTTRVQSVECVPFEGCFTEIKTTVFPEDEGGFDRDSDGKEIEWIELTEVREGCWIQDDVTGEWSVCDCCCEETIMGVVCVDNYPCETATPTPTAEPTSTPTATDNPFETPTATPTATATATATGTGSTPTPTITDALP